MSKFKKVETGIEGLVIIEPRVFGDERGYFMETYSEKDFADIGLNMKFVQDNESRSKQGVLRGLHFQTKHSQGKLVRVTKGEVFDVGVDMRKNSKTYGKWFGVYLTDENKKQFYVPEGFAHGFLVISEFAEFVYKCTNFYHPEYEKGIIWNDKTIGIEWPLDRVSEIILSDKDKNAESFSL
jgi:dTDP-4-dehydrorhamnose 3,5-epimerase